MHKNGENFEIMSTKVFLIDYVKLIDSSRSIESCDSSTSICIIKSEILSLYFSIYFIRGFLRDSRLAFRINRSIGGS